MALEWRNGRVYFYKSRRVRGRVAKVYGGAGLIAELSAKLEAARRELRRLDRQQVVLDRVEFRAATDAHRDWFEAVDRVVAAALERSGWHRVRRQWRKKRGAVVTGLQNVADLTWVPSELAAAAGDLDPEVAEKAKVKDKAALKVVDEYLANPAARAYWGDLGRYVLNRWAGQFAGGNEVARRAVLAFASDLRARLAGPAPSALDTLLAERVVLAWLYLNWCEDQYVRQLGKLTLAGSDGHHKRIDMAHRKLMAACQTLAKVKKAKLPDVLAVVNVGRPGSAGGAAGATALPRAGAVE